MRGLECRFLDVASVVSFVFIPWFICVWVHDFQRVALPTDSECHFFGSIRILPLSCAQQFTSSAGAFLSLRLLHFVVCFVVVLHVELRRFSSLHVFVCFVPLGPCDLIFVSLLPLTDGFFGIAFLVVCMCCHSALWFVCACPFSACFGSLRVLVLGFSGSYWHLPICVRSFSPLRLYSVPLIAHRRVS